jgi:hypothetical protein
MLKALKKFQINEQNTQSFLLLLFFTFITYNLFHSIIFFEALKFRIDNSDGYALGDWLINFEDGGFKRRGLGGSFFLWVSRLTNVYVGNLVYYFILFFYFLFVGLTWFYLKSKKISLQFWAILLTPSCFLFFVNDQYAFGRKEILLFTIGILYLLLTQKNKIREWKYSILIASLIFVFSFFHELIFFYLPYFVIIAYIHSKQNNLQLPIKQLGLIVMSSFIPTVLIFFLGGDINQGQTWSVLKEYGVKESIMEGIMSWPKEGFSGDKQNALKFAREHNYKTYLISFLITYIPILLFVIKYKTTLLTLKNFFLISLAALLFSWPIFFLTIDWGRWLNIHFIFIILTFSLFLPFFNTENNRIYNLKKKPILNLKSVLPRTLLLIFMILNLFSWRMKHVDKGFLIERNNTYLTVRKILLSFKN